MSYLVEHIPLCLKVVCHVQGHVRCCLGDGHVRLFATVIAQASFYGLVEGLHDTAEPVSVKQCS